MELQNVPAFKTTIHDRVFLRVFTNNTSENIRLRARWIQPDGNLIHTEFTIDTTASVPSFLDSQLLGEGLLYSISVVDLNSQLIHGECYVQAGILSRGAALTDASIVLVEAYLTGNRPLSWPGSKREDMREGPGHFQVITIADPAAGANFIQTVPDNEHWLIRRGRMNFTADANAANREVSIRLDDSVGIMSTQIVATQVVTAGQLEYFHWAPHFDAASSAQLTMDVTRMPCPEWRAGPGDKIVSRVTNIQAGDITELARLTISAWMTD